MARRIPSVPRVVASEASECGAVCIAMVLGYYGHWAKRQEIRDRCGTSRDGTNIHAMARAATHFGMDVGTVVVDLWEIPKVPMPCIVHMDFDHFMVLRGVSKGLYHVSDPGPLGNATLTEQEFAKRFTGIALALMPGERFEVKGPESRIKDLRLVLGGSMPYLLGIAWVSILILGCELVAPFLDRMVFDWAIPSGDQNRLFYAGGAACLGYMLISIAQATRSLLFREMRSKVDLRLMEEVFTRILRTPLRQSILRPLSQTISKMAKVAQLRVKITESALPAMFDAMTVLAYSLLLGRYRLGWGLAALGYCLLVILFMNRMFRQKAPLEVRREQVETQVVAGITEAGDHFEVVRAIRAEQSVIDSWAKGSVLAMGLKGELSSLAGRYKFGLQQLMAVFSLGITGTAAFAFLRGDLTAGTLAVAVMASRGITANMNSLVNFFATMGEIEGSLHAIGDVLEDQQEEQGGGRPAECKGQIRIQEVSFGFAQNGPLVVNGVSLDIRPGETIGIVGPSGSGKSTLARLISGLLEPTAGTISLDGVPINELDRHWYRRQLGFVLQECYLFDDTIAYNIHMGRDCTKEQLSRAVTAAGLQGLVNSLPLGLETRLGGHGDRLSGGQRQRITLARALVMEPRILILDEATSALDLETERLVHDSIAKMATTKIIVAHRLETVRCADRIVFMEKGLVTGAGTFAELLVTHDGFRQMCLDSGVVQGVSNA